MASFHIALALALDSEGGYSSDPKDPGGETYKGVSRRAHPNWIGWNEIDRVRGRAGFPSNLEANGELQRAVVAFYRENFWRPLRGDDLPNQAVANELLDTAINLGIADAGIFLQVALNALNRGDRGPSKQLYPDLAEDGRVGDKTLAALRAYLETDPPEHLLTLMNCFQGVDYVVDGDFARVLARFKRGTWRKRFVRGWLKRVCLSKT